MERKENGRTFSVKPAAGFLGRVAALALLTCALAAEVRPQNIQLTAGNTNSATSVNAEIDPSSLGLNLRLTLASNPGRKGMNMPVILQYSSKVWEIRYYGAVDRAPEMPNVESTLTEAQYQHGWTSNLNPPFLEFDSATYNENGQPFDINWKDYPNSWFVVPRIRVKLSDGSVHELRKGDWFYEQFAGQPVPAWVFAGTYYAVDGSNLRYDTGTRTLYMPDGSRYLYEVNGVQATQFVDRNGNVVTFEQANRRWLDTLGRPVDLPNLDPVSTPQDVAYSVTGINNTDITYVLKWRRLADVRTDPSQPLRYNGDSSNGSLNVPDRTPALFASSPPHDYVIESNGAVFNPVVLHEIAFPNGATYKFTYNVWGEIDKVVYPSGGYERFRYDMVQGTSWVSGPYNQANRGVVERWISPTGTAAGETRWQYTASMGGSVATPTQIVSEIAFDNSRTERHFFAGSGFTQFNVEDSRVGLLLEERVYNAGGTMVRRRLKHYEVTGFISSRPLGAYGFHPASTNRNPRAIKEAEILLDPGAPAPLSNVKRYQYDANLNVRFSWEHVFQQLSDRSAGETLPINSLPEGDVARTTEYTYLTGGAYSNFSGLVSSMRVTDGAGRLAHLTEYFYDETATTGYGGTPAGWLDPQTTARGNATTQRRWIDGATYVDTHAAYDIFGNEVSNTDGLNRTTAFEFSAANQYAYQTRVILPPADPSGATGSQFESDYHTAYDFWTGTVLSTTDANDHVTTYAHAEPMQRVTLISKPDGGWTSFEYGETPFAFSLRTRTAQDSAQVVESYEFYDGLMRPRRRSENEGATWRAIDIEYDGHGREWRRSNPHRSTTADGNINPPGVWAATTVYDVLGRAVTVTGPDGGTVTTDYSNNAVTITDPANYQVRSVADTFGNVVQVIEAPNSAAPLVSDYVYDGSNQLRKVTQQSAELGVTQARYFKYDLLGRLTRVKHPESDSNAAYDEADDVSGHGSWSMKLVYDAGDNLKEQWDARGVKVTHEYDAYDRLTKRIYATPAGVADTPTVSYFYDGAGVPGGIQNSRGSRTKVQSSVSTTTADVFDVMGRIKQTTQTVEGNAYTMLYDYDYAGHVTAQTYPSGRVVRNDFDRAQRLTEISGQMPGESTRKPYASQIDYAPHWGPSSYRLGNGLYGQVSYNENLQRSHVKLGTAVGDASAFKLENFYTSPGLGNNGNLRKQVVTSPGVANTQEYLYDDYDRLEDAKENGGASWRQKFSYDRFGNRRLDAALTTPALVGPNPTANAANNRLHNYGYDAAGNVSADPQGHSYEYNANGLLARFDNGAATYAYDGNDRRVRKTVGGVSTYYVYNVAGQLVAEYTTGTTTANGTSYMTADHTGSPRVITNQGGAVRERHDYLPFGEELTAAYGGRGQDATYGVASSIRQKFTGVERDAESGLDYFGARYYASSVGRFTGPDPLHASGVITDPQTWNRYAYVSNNPFKYVDIGGLLKRKKDGALDYKKKATGTLSHDGAPGVTWKGEGGTIKTDDGKHEIKVVRSNDEDTRMDTNCHGLTFADGEYAIDNTQVKSLLEGDGYKETSTPVVGDVVVYYDQDASGNQTVVHSATVTAVDDKGNVTEVSGLGGIQPASTSTTPQNGFSVPPAPGTERVFKVYHSNNRTDAERAKNAERAKTHDKAAARAKKKEEAEKKKAKEKEEKEKRKQQRKEKNNKPKSGDGPRENDNGAEPGVDNY